MGAAPTLQRMVEATLALAAAIFESTSAAQDCPSSTQQVTTGGVGLPEGSEDGIYLATNLKVVDEQGVEQHEVKYLGKGNLTLGSPPLILLGPKLLEREEVMCQWGYQLSALDILNAVTRMAKYWFGTEGQFWDSQMLSISGCTLAYACNLWDTGTQVYRYHTAITNTCGRTTGGCYSHTACIWG